jgi:hypothetical protein
MNHSEAQDLIVTVRQAYQITRLEPRGGKYRQVHDGRECGCAVGVLHRAYAIGTESLWDTFHRLTGATTAQRAEFETGFDSAFRPTHYYDDYAPLQSVWWNVGRSCGMAVRPRLTTPKETT